MWDDDSDTSSTFDDPSTFQGCWMPFLMGLTLKIYFFPNPKQIVMEQNEMINHKF